MNKLANKPLKNPTATIYQCLGPAFWTKRKCGNCQQLFTKENYQKHNYYLIFDEIGDVWTSSEFPEPRDNACLDAVIVRLFHQHCQLVKNPPKKCQIEILKDITCP